MFDTNSSVTTDETNLADASAKSELAGNLADASAKIQTDDNLAVATAKTDNALAPLLLTSVPIAAFFSIGFSHHTLILSKVKTAEERNFYIQLCANMKLSYDELERQIAENAQAA